MQVCRLGCRAYGPTLQAMREFNAARTTTTEDQLWLVEHEPVYTQGIAGRDEHVLDSRGIAVVRTERGGQVTYHGPGQVVAYPLVDLRRLKLHVREYVYRLEQALLNTLAAWQVTGHRVPGAPGIYVRVGDPFGHAVLTRSEVSVGAFEGLGKIAALGIKVSRHCAYHGVALNVRMDLRPFDGIDPCGFAGLKTIDLATLGVTIPWAEVADELARRLVNQLGSAAASD